MKKRVSFSSILTIFTVVLMVVTVLSSCSANNPSQDLVSVRLDDSESRRLSSKLTPKGLGSLYYYPMYLGTGNHYPNNTKSKSEISEEDYLTYDDSKGIVLSQGLWEILCLYKNDKYEVVLTGTTGPVWVNLNTSLFSVQFSDNSFSITYSVISESKKSIICEASIFSFENGNLSLTPVESIELPLTSKPIISPTSEKSIKKSVFNYSRSDFNKAGCFALVVYVRDETDNSILFTDVIGFVSRFGNDILIKGSCEIEEGSNGGSCIYLPNISDPTDPMTSEYIDATNNPDPKNEGEKALNAENIKDNTVYVINPDSGSTSMTLGHTDSKNQKSERIVIDPNGAEFGINLKGTNVTLTTLSGIEEKFTESSAIVVLEPNSNMTLYNYATESKDATWAFMEKIRFLFTSEVRRFEANTLIKGGTLNIVGNNSPSGISNAKVFFRGPVATDSDTYRTLTELDNTTVKQGAINLYSPGGVINLDGDVQLDAAVGISSWETSKTNNAYTSTIKDELNCQITIQNGASIVAVGDMNDSRWKDTAHGIYILGKNNTGSIKIVLDNGHISASSSGLEECGIRIENFNGTIEIELKNGSSISSTEGTGIKMIGCPNIKITKDSTSSISGGSNAFISDNKTVNEISNDSSFSLKMENGNIV